jgi:hypothetical protein
MDINFEQITKSITDILLGIFDQNKPTVIAVVDGYIADSKGRITNLAQGVVSGELSYAFVVKRLKEEAVNVKDYALSIGEIIAADIQSIVNKIVAIFQNALNDILGIND